VGAISALVTAVTWFAFHPMRGGSVAMIGSVAALYVVLAGVACWSLARDGVLRKQMLPSRGDVTVGALLALLMHIAARLTVASFKGTSLEPWVMRLYLQIGDPRVTAMVWVGVGVLVVAALEEIAWRGLVMRQLIRAHGPTKGWLIATALYAAVHLPTLTLLGDPAMGLNPLVVLAALGCGLVWGYLAMKIDRLGPSIFAHAFFSWSVVTYPMWSL
jgi:hypothetical protein